MKKHLFVGLITTISLFSLVAMAQAALIQYTSFATWNAAVGPATGTENFNSFLVDAEFRTTTVAANNMTIAGEPGSNGSLTNKIDAPPWKVVIILTIINIIGYKHKRDSALSFYFR